MSGVIATSPHEGKLQDAIHALKYYGAIDLAAPLAQRLIVCLEATEWTYDTIIPVPLYITRLRERGYNQSQIIGLKLAEALNMPLIPTALERQRQTTSQVGLSREERAKNVDGAFRAASNIVTGKRILLIDDVLTTGATLLACTAALFDAGATAVYGITVTAARH
ncbi:MAG: ComF family protein [Chloroflexi bacterium]|nr:MAG: ComF family protein [Chloroflexota bacterium]